MRKLYKFKKYACFILFIISSIDCLAQRFGFSLDCNINAQDNTPEYLRDYRTPPREATVRIDFDGAGFCTGTIINRNIDDNNLGFYLLTARHCISDGEDININLSEDARHVLYFNYQSLDGDNASTDNWNRGLTDWQSGDFDSSTISPGFRFNGYEYRHVTALRIVEDFRWGDFVLFEVLTPIPPHFNITYAGWNPGNTYRGTSSGVPTDQSFEHYIGIHHPRGDIKKISTVPEISWNETPVGFTCYTVTRVIDYLFGWVWGRRVSTQVICRQLTNPYFSVLGWHRGIIEEGSSGSGMFNATNRQIGILSHDLVPLNYDRCDNPFHTYYGKFHTNYANRRIKNELNPGGSNVNNPYNRAGVDLFGITSRKIGCYDNLDLPGAPGVSGHYFPANHYQPENTIWLRSRNNITTNAPIRVYNGADYRFQAAGVIDITDNFEVEEGAFVEMQIGNCPAGKEPSPESLMAQRLKEHSLPKEKKLDMQRFGSGQLYASPDKQSYLQVFPNPTTGAFTLRFSQAGSYRVSVKDMLGKEVVAQEGKNVAELSMQLNVPAGQYYVVVKDEQNRMQYGKVTVIE